MFGNKKLKSEIERLKKENEDQSKTINEYKYILSDCYVHNSKGHFMRYRKEYIVTEKDLIGDLKGFPIEVVHKMVDYQVKQGNKADVTIFQKNKTSGEYGRGFTWNKTKERFDFWHNVIEFRHFDTFFEKYPKNNK